MGPSLEADLAALVYGARSELGQQFALGSDLDGALARGDVDAVSALRERSGFADALDDLDLSSRAEHGAVELSRMIAVLNTAGALGDPAVSAPSAPASTRRVRVLGR